MDDKQVYFSVAEEEIIEHLQNIYGITRVEAAEAVIHQKRELAFIHYQRGHLKLAEQIFRELGEWNDELAELFENSPEYKGSEKQIIIVEK